MDERKSLKLNIQRTTISVLVVLSLLIGVSAAKIPQIDVISLADLPFDIVDNGDGTDTVTQSLYPEPYWDLENVPLVGPTGVYTENPFLIEITGDAANDSHLITGFMWPVGYLDIDGIAPNGILDLSYSCAFQLFSYGSDGGEFATSGYVAFVPRYRLLDENYNQVAMVTGSTYRYDFNTDPEEFSAATFFDQVIYLPEDTPVRYIELKWKFYLSLQPVYSDWSLMFNVNESAFDLEYRLEHVLTDSELAAKFNDDMGKANSELDKLGDAMASVPKPDVDSVIVSPDDLIGQDGKNALNLVYGNLFASSLILGQFAIVGALMVVSYILFGKKA